MPIFNMVGAGNGGEDLPIGSRIIVTSDEGAVIKCAKGTTSEEQTVPASGTVTFTVHISGIWQITASKGDETDITKTQAVILDDTDYPIKVMPKLFLYKDGVDATGITGGIVKYNYPLISTYTAQTPTFNPTNISLQAHYGTWSCAVATTNKVNVSLYDSLKAYCNMNIPEDAHARFGIMNSNNVPYNTNFVAHTAIDGTPGYITPVVDISSYSSTYYILFGAHNSGSILERVWLE